MQNERKPSGGSVHLRNDHAYVTEYAFLVLPILSLNQKAMQLQDKDCMNHLSHENKIILI